MKKKTENISFIEASRHRKAVLEQLYRTPRQTPSEITNKLHIHGSGVRKVLKEFRERGIARCVNENARMGRMYKLTEYGREMLYTYPLTKLLRVNEN